MCTPTAPGNAANQTELYTAKVPHWRSTWSAYRSNAPRPGPSRSHIQQETKWSWENMIDEMADSFGVDPVQYRMMHMTQLTPSDTLHQYETMPTVEVLQEGSKAFGWEKRNPVAGGEPGRFKRGFGLGMSQHHGGNMGYHEGEEAYAKLAALPRSERRFQQRRGRHLRWQRDHEDCASRQRLQRGHGTGSDGRGDVGIHDVRPDPPGLGRFGPRAPER